MCRFKVLASKAVASPRRMLSEADDGMRPEAGQRQHVSRVVFWWLNSVRLYSLYKILYPERRI